MSERFLPMEYPELITTALDELYKRRSDAVSVGS